MTAEGAEDYGYLLRSSDGLQALLESLAASNSSMDVAGWVGHPNLEGIPKQILWASGWSEEWQHEGEQLAAVLPAASFHSHHGSRWPQVCFCLLHIDILSVSWQSFLYHLAERRTQIYLCATTLVTLVW